jgi:hypothetical protein
MHMLERRFQILLDEARYERLASEATARGVSIGALIREAIDRTLPEASARKGRALERILTAPDMPVPEPGDLRTELKKIRGRRG